MVALAAGLAACASAPQPACLPAESQRAPDSGLGPVPGSEQALEDCTASATLIARGDAGLEVPAPGVSIFQPPAMTLSHARALSLPDGLRLELVEVLEDSRCPRGVQCVWAGRARIRLVAAKPGTRPAQLEVSLAGPTVRYLDYDIRLLALDPQPVSGRRTPRGDYVATLSIRPASGEVPDKDPAPDLPRR